MKIDVIGGITAIEVGWKFRRENGYYLHKEKKDEIRQVKSKAATWVKSENVRNGDAEATITSENHQGM